MTIYSLKPRFQQLLRPLLQGLHAARITPNHVTILALLLSVAMGLVIYLFPEQRWLMILLPIVLLIRMALNAIDGMLAREYNLKSPLGAYLNEFGDIISDIALYLPFLVLPLVDSVALLTFAFLLMLSETAGILACQIGAPRRYDGPMGKSDRAFLFGIIAIALACGFTSKTGISFVLWLADILLLLTIFNRIKGALNAITHV
jgi:CDP-diacylglycerol---glycerol-3-phosphate 3-phosphatidyltransferase